MIDPISVALILSSIAGFSILGGIFICCIFLIFRTSDLKAMSEDMAQVRFYITDWLEKDGPLQGKKQPITYQSSDGKFQAPSLDELLQMMTNDPDSSISSSDMEALKRIFEQISKDDGLDDENENDDKEIEDGENWKEGE